MRSARLVSGATQRRLPPTWVRSNGRSNARRPGPCLIVDRTRSSLRVQAAVPSSTARIAPPTARSHSDTPASAVPKAVSKRSGGAIPSFAFPVRPQVVWDSSSVAWREVGRAGSGEPAASPVQRAGGDHAGRSESDGGEQHRAPARGRSCCSWWCGCPVARVGGVPAARWVVVKPEGALDGVAVGGDWAPVEGGRRVGPLSRQGLAGPGLQQSRRQASVMSPADGGSRARGARVQPVPTLE